MTEVNLTMYDVILVNSSGGKDSQAMLDHVCALAKAANVLDRVTVVHCDLGRVEWAGTRDLAERQAQHYGVRFEVISRPQGDLLTHIEAHGKFPSNKQRYCTSDHKRGQVDKVITKLVNELAGLGRQVRVLNCMGLRAAESSARSKKAPFETNKRASNGKRHVDQWLPIFTWSVEDVWANIRASGVEHHKAYDLGMPRLSCCFCIFASKPALVLAGKHNRGLLAQYVEVEAKIGHQFRQDVSLAEVARAVDAGEDCGEIKTWEM